MYKAPKSLELERALISCFFKDPGWLGEISSHLKSDFFHYLPHQKIFAAIKSLYNETKTLDQHILVSRLNLMGLTTIESLEIDDYILLISDMAINLGAKGTYLNDLMKFYWARQTWKKLDDAKKYIEKSLEVPDLQFHDILHGTEKIVTDALTVESVNGDDTRFIDLNGDMEDLINQRAGRKGSLGIDSPFETFNRWFGQFLIGGLYIFAASAKVGKSSMLSALTDYATEHNKKEKGVVKVLFIDTELNEEEVACRKLAAESGVNAVFYLNGKFSEDADKIEKTEEAYKAFKSRAGLFYHYYLPTAETEEIEKVARRFHSKHVGPDDTLILVLDYLKISGGEDRSAGNGQALKEYEMVGQKTDAMKKLAEEIPNTISITAIQTNRENDIAQADRVKWYATGVFHLSRKTPEEIGSEGKLFGTHKLKSIVVRNLGEYADESGPFAVEVGNKTEWHENYINLNFSNFRVTEAGTRKDAMKYLEKAGQLTPRESTADKQKKTFSQQYGKK